MSEVIKRYTFFAYLDDDVAELDCHEEEDGNYVLASDYDKLDQEYCMVLESVVLDAETIHRLEAELAELKAKMEGWQLVPKNPTPEMRTAAIGVEVYADSPVIADCLTWAEAEAIYKAMLAAAE